MFVHQELFDKCFILLNKTKCKGEWKETDDVEI